MKRIAVLGSTGSIGTQTLDVVRRLPHRLRITALSAGSNATLLARQALEFEASAVAIFNEHERGPLEAALPGSVSVSYGADGLEEIATRSDVDLVVVAVAGSVGTRATLTALRAGKDVALATKEVLVAAGKLVREAAKAGRGRILPIDSEHAAILQCIDGQQRENISKLWITASGGPFRTLSNDELRRVTREDALKHPTWNMGPKITVDSATLMNKGLESIEAHWFFDVPIEQIEVVVHPQSIVHSFVEMRDGSLLAQLGVPDMRLPILYALLYPERVDVGLPRLDPRSMGSLTFEAPDLERFRCLGLARDAARTGGTMPAVLNAANEEAVKLFLNAEIGFVAIPEVIEKAMNAHDSVTIADPDLEQILASDAWARRFIRGNTGVHKDSLLAV